MKYLLSFLCLFFLAVTPAHSQEPEIDHRFAFFDIKPGMTLKEASQKVEAYGGEIKYFADPNKPRSPLHLYKFWAMMEIKSKAGVVDPRQELMKKYQKLLPNNNSSKAFRILLHTYPLEIQQRTDTNTENLIIYMIEADILQKNTDKKKKTPVKLPPHLAHLQDLNAHNFNLGELIENISQHGHLTEAMHQTNEEKRYHMLWRDVSAAQNIKPLTADDVLDLRFIANQKPTLESCLKTAAIAQSIEIYAASELPTLSDYFKSILTQDPLPAWQHCGNMVHAAMIIPNKEQPPTGVQIINYNMPELIKAYEGLSKILQEAGQTK